MISKNTLIIIIFIIYSIYLSSRAIVASESSIGIETVNECAIVFFIGYDEDGQVVGQCTATFLWNYHSSDSVYLITATHCVQGSTAFNLFWLDGHEKKESLFNAPINLADSLGNPKYLTYIKGNGQIADLVLIPIEKKPLNARKSKIIVHSKSFCAFDSSVNVGDHVLAFGFADYGIFDFTLTGRPLCTSGIIAFKTIHSYLMNEKTHHGMSGGIVYKELPRNEYYIYQIIGIISAGLSKYDKYSWITKIDYVDSILIQNTGKKWTDSNNSDSD